jgi:multiple sugar transport system permease protein
MTLGALSQEDTMASIRTGAGALSARGARHSKRRTPWLTVILLVAPFLVVYAAFLIYPTVRVVLLSFTNADIAGKGSYVGAANYVKLWHDSLFWSSLWHTLYFILLTVIPNTALGLIFGLIVVRQKPILRGIVLVLLFMPYVLPVGVVTQIYLWVLSSAYGIVNYIFNVRINWFQDPRWAMPSVAFVTIWWTVGFNMLLFIAGLEAIPREYYEAASLEGAGSGVRVFRYITWPLVWPVTSLVFVLQLISQWQIFNQVYLLTNGGPFNKTIVVLMYMYQQAFTRYKGGYAATISLALFVLILLTSLAQIRLLRFRGNK